MPLPPLLLFTVASGLAAALASRQELCTSPRPVMLTRSFFAYVSYAVLVVVPVSVYFYVFHGDWFLLYWLDVSKVPSAIALIGFGLQAAVGALAFLLGALLVRSHRELAVGVLIGSLLTGAVVIAVSFADRLAQVGSFAQFHGRFGLEPWTRGALLPGALAMLAIAFAGLAFLLVRLWKAGTK